MQSMFCSGCNMGVGGGGWGGATNLIFELQRHHTIALNKRNEATRVSGGQYVSLYMHVTISS